MTRLNSTQENTLTEIMTSLKQLFPPGYRLTLIARDTTMPQDKKKGTLICSEDDLEKVQKALYEERTAHETGIVFSS